MDDQLSIAHTALACNTTGPPEVFLPLTLHPVPPAVGEDSDRDNPEVFGEATLPPPVTEYPGGQFAVAVNCLPLDTATLTLLEIDVTSAVLTGAEK